MRLQRKKLARKLMNTITIESALRKWFAVRRIQRKFKAWLKTRDPTYTDNANPASFAALKAYCDRVLAGEELDGFVDKAERHYPKPWLTPKQRKEMIYWHPTPHVPPKEDVKRAPSPKGRGGPK